MNKRSNRPNILLLLGDHEIFHGHDGPGTIGFRWPRFDAFAAQGVRFDHAYCVSPLCSPARSSLWTGMYPFAHGISWNTKMLGCPEDFRQGQLLYSHHLSRAGYRNAYIGKWHCGDERTPIDYGIEGWAPPGYGAVYALPQYHAWLEASGIKDPQLSIECLPGRPELRGTTQPLAPHTLRFFRASGVLRAPRAAHESDFVAAETIGKMRELAKGSQPWSLISSFWAPHFPYFPTEPFAGMVDPGIIPEYPTFRDESRDRPIRNTLVAGHHPHHATELRGWPDWQPMLARAYEQGYQTDAAMGQILDALDELGLAENTLVLWTADHGDAIASHGGLFDKGTMSEEVLRIRFAARWPAAFRGGVSCDSPITNMDVTATMLEAAGAAIPPEMHSRSLLPSCRAEASLPDHVVIQHDGLWFHTTVRAAATRRYKYVADLFDRHELYDLENDPWEKNNLIDSPAHIDVAEDLRAKILAHIETTGDPLAEGLGMRLRGR